MNNDFAPYANESDVLRIGGLEIENRIDRVTLTGDLVFTKDQAGQALAQELQALVEKILAQLQNHADLPDAVTTVPTKTVRNPFA